MITVRSPQCRFWSCSTPVREGDPWCREHRRAFQRGLVDDCPECGRGKELRFPTCLECRRVPTAFSGERESPMGSDARGVYVYVLQLKEGDFFAGYACDLRVRLMEHHEGIIPRTAGRFPRLVWFRVVESRVAAELLKLSVRRLCRDDPREIRRWIIRLKDIGGAVVTMGPVCPSARWPAGMRRRSAIRPR